MRIGIDVGGTNTDAVLMQGESVIAAVKRSTTNDVLSGINAALMALSDRHPFAAEEIQAVMLGTTHFTNAIVSISGLSETAVVRLGLPSSSAVTPMFSWPHELAGALGRHVFEAHGGNEFDGRPISDIQPDELREIAEDIGKKQIKAIAIVSVFSPLTNDAELMAKEIFEQELPDVKISLSHEIGTVGLLERENATIINASLLALAGKATMAFENALTASGITAPLYLSQNDGTLMDVKFAQRFPVTTFASGPTNSMRGAALLSDLNNCLVVDIGGTTADIGIMVDGFPRQATSEVEIGGVRTNFRMPDILSLGIGGGSQIEADPIKVGPKSVGYRLNSEALVFGGSTLTATDIAVAAGLADIGDSSRVAHLDKDFVQNVLKDIAERIATAADMMRTSTAPLPIVLVGGGSILVDGDLNGFASVVRPKHAEVANAVGAAIAQVGGELDRVLALEGTNRTEVLEQVKAEAIDKAVTSGAKRESVGIVEIDEVPIAYLPGDCVRFRVKAVGDLNLVASTK